jgi:hypothetical protein
VTDKPSGRCALGSLTSLVGRAIPPVRTGSALALATSNDRVDRRVLVKLRAVGALSGLAALHIDSLRDWLKVGNLNAVSVDASALGHVVDGHAVRDRPDFPLPRLTVGIPSAPDLAVTVGVMRPLPAQAARLRVPQRCRVVIPALALRRRSALLGLVAAGHVAVHALPVARCKLSAALLAGKHHGGAEAFSGRAGGRAEPLLPPALGRVVRVVLGSAPRASACDRHSRHRTSIALTCVNPVRAEGSEGVA